MHLSFPAPCNIGFQSTFDSTSHNPSPSKRRRTCKVRAVETTSALMLTHVLIRRALPTHKADVFESYVGGLYKDQGLPATKAWLDKLFTPYVKEAYRIVREQHGLPPAGVSNELQVVTGTGLKPPTPPPELPRMGMATTTLGHLGLFNQRLQQQCLSIEWVFDDTVTESNRATPVWAAKALVDGACWGYGRGNTKKSAKNEAAKEGLRHMGFDEGY